MTTRDLTSLPCPEELVLLAGLFSEPVDESKEVILELAEEHPWLGPAAAELAETALVDWQAEHTRLFISGHPGTPCPPFESAYREGRMWGDSADAWDEIHRWAGTDPGGLPPDFLGSALSVVAAQLAADPPDPQGIAIAGWERLARWLPDFARDLQDNSALVLYRALGERLSALTAPVATP